MLFTFLLASLIVCAVTSVLLWTTKPAKYPKFFILAIPLTWLVSGSLSLVLGVTLLFNYISSLLA